MASEIHDTLSQTLSAAALQLEAAGMALEREPAKVRSHMDLALGLIRQGQEEVRRSVWALPPWDLESRPLPEALRLLAQRLSAAASLRAEFALEGEPVPLSRALSSHLLRITQEAANNAIRHAHARHIRIRLAYAPHRVELGIANDGRRFRGARAASRRGAGLPNMRSRAKRMGARFSIRTGEKSGAEVRVTLPFVPPES